MRIVLDTNILARANPRAKGPARRLLLEIAGYIRALEEFSELVPPPATASPLMKDPDDEPVLQTAVMA